MGSDMENNKPNSELRDKMLVFVNNDWHRTYVASIHTINLPDGTKLFSAKCKMRDFSIVGTAKNKLRLSMYMDDLATIIEEYTSPKLPYGIPMVLDTICCLN